ncbi:MAG: DUF4358 domain-containing protein [Clostridia bacterium]|nr:DUF4358 domain-containing protein [Clostridia bacterium]
MMKRIFTVLLTLSLTVSFASCFRAYSFADNVMISEITEEILDELNSPLHYMVDNTGFTDEYFALPDYVTEHAVLYTGDTNNIDEFGIFHVTDGNASAMETLLRERYLTASYEKNREFYDSYIPDESPKLRDAEVKSIGNYVVYAIMSAADRNTVFNAVRDELEINE